MGLGTTLKIKISEIAAADLSRSASEGRMGSFAQRAYIATKGYKTVIGTALFAISSALTQYAPPGSAKYLWGLSFLSAILAAAGLIDKAARNQPVFEPWFLDALARVTAWISAGSAVAAWMVSQHVFDHLLPHDPCVKDMVIGVFAALTSATAMLNRLANASAAKPGGTPA